MKTHDLAKALNHLSRVLRAGPNIELDSLVNLGTYVESRPSKKASTEEVDRGAALVLLSEMANYSKRELIELAGTLNIPIEVRPADAVRDVLGKILKYINENPDMKSRLTSPATEKQSSKVSTLSRALAILLDAS
jgi:hypothetical protein